MKNRLGNTKDKMLDIFKDKKGMSLAPEMFLDHFYGSIGISRLYFGSNKDVTEDQLKVYADELVKEDKIEYVGSGKYMFKGRKFRLK